MPGGYNRLRGINDRQKNLGPGTAQISLESAAHDARGGSPANPDHASDAAERRARVRRESGALIHWADSQGILRKGYHILQVIIP